MARRALLGTMIILALATAWIIRENIEARRWRFNHGHGYWSVNELVPMPRGFWERFGHYQLLFDGPVNLGHVAGGFSISPDGAFAALERDDLILIYVRQAGAIDTLAAGHAKNGFKWDIRTRTLSFGLDSGRDTVIHLDRLQ